MKEKYENSQKEIQTLRKKINESQTLLFTSFRKAITREITWNFELIKSNQQYESDYFCYHDQLWCLNFVGKSNDDATSAGFYVNLIHPTLTVFHVTITFTICHHNLVDYSKQLNKVSVFGPGQPQQRGLDNFIDSQTLKKYFLNKLKLVRLRVTFSDPIYSRGRVDRSIVMVEQSCDGHVPTSGEEEHEPVVRPPPLRRRSHGRHEAQDEGMHNRKKRLLPSSLPALKATAASMDALEDRKSRVSSPPALRAASAPVEALENRNSRVSSPPALRATSAPVDEVEDSTDTFVSDPSVYQALRPAGGSGYTRLARRDTPKRRL